MPWQNSNNTHLPPGWKQLRQRVIARANGNCEASDCIYEGTEVDHIVNVASGGTHDVGNLQLLCKWHHRQKTQAEAQAKKTKPPTLYRPKEAHPGYTG